jgi:hypothetical protein
MKKPTCPCCGSDNITVLAHLRWSPKSRRYLPAYIDHEDGWHCLDCAELTRLGVGVETAVVFGSTVATKVPVRGFDSHPSDEEKPRPVWVEVP